VADPVGPVVVLAVVVIVHLFLGSSQRVRPMVHKILETVLNPKVKDQRCTVCVMPP
jgi:hypothetical protein